MIKLNRPRPLHPAPPACVCLGTSAPVGPWGNVDVFFSPHLLLTLNLLVSHVRRIKIQLRRDLNSSLIALTPFACYTYYTGSEAQFLTNIAGVKKKDNFPVKLRGQRTELPGILMVAYILYSPPTGKSLLSRMTIVQMDYAVS